MSANDKRNVPVLQVHETPGMLLEKPVPLDVYVDKGWQLASVGFRPFFPGLASVADAEQTNLQQSFKAQATVLGRNMLNAEGLVEDRHTNLWVTAHAAQSS